MALRIDIEPGSEYLLPFAKKKLEQLKRDTPALVNKRIFVSTGEEIFVQRGFVDLIRIRGGILYPLFLATGLNQPNLVALTNFQITADLFTRNGLPVPDTLPAPFSLGMRNGRMVFGPAMDPINFRIMLLARAIKQQQYLIAREIVNYIESDGGGGYIDAAVYDPDDGFYVDLSLFSDRDYLPALTAAVGSHASTIAHPAPEEVNAFPEFDISKWTPGNNFDNDDYHQYVYVDADGHEVRLPNCEMLGYGGALLNVTQIRDFTTSLPLGTKIVHRVFAIEPILNLWYWNDVQWRDMVNATALTFIEAQYTVTTSGVNSFFATSDHFSDTATTGTGPVSGYREIRVQRYRSLRGNSGWHLKEYTNLPVTPVLGFTADAQDPPNIITPAIGSVNLDVNITTDGVPQTVGTVVFNAGAISMTHPPELAPTLFARVGQQPRGDLGGNHAVYAEQQEITLDTGINGAPIYQRYTTLNGRTRFNLHLSGQIDVVDQQTGALLASVSAQRENWNVSFNTSGASAKQWTVGAGTQSAATADAAVAIQLATWPSPYKTFDLPVPPAYFSRECVMDLKNGRFLYADATEYFTGTDGLADLFNYIFLLRVGAPTQTLSTARALALSHFNILASSGLADEAALFIAFGAGLNTVFL